MLERLEIPGALDGRKLNAIVHRPLSVRDLRSAVILLHGGGLRVGSPSEMEPYAVELAAAGFLVLAPEYRLLGEAAWPAQLSDVLAALHWLHANSGSLGISPDRIAIQGFSAGGHLALLAARTAGAPGSVPNLGPHVHVKAIASLFAPTNFTVGPPTLHEAPAAMLLGARATPESARAISPLAHVVPGFPPTFLLQGMNDPLVAPAMTLRFFEALVLHGVKAELHCFHDHTHEFARLPSMLRAVQAEIVLFLRRSMVDPVYFANENHTLNPFARYPEGILPASSSPNIGAA